MLPNNREVVSDRPLSQGKVYQRPIKKEISKGKFPKIANIRHSIAIVCLIMNNSKMLWKIGERRARPGRGCIFGWFGRKKYKNKLICIKMYTC